MKQTSLDDAILSAGTTFVVESQHPDCLDHYEFRIITDGAREVLCLCPDLPNDAFRAVFEDGAIERADALLAVTQTNPVERHANQSDADCEYHGPDKPRGYTFRQTLPPFLLSRQLAAQVRNREIISVHFYDFLDDGAPVRLCHESDVEGQLEIDGEPRPVRLVRYVGAPGFEDEDLEMEIVDGTRIVVRISRSLQDFEMRVVGVVSGKAPP